MIRPLAANLGSQRLGAIRVAIVFEGPGHRRQLVTLSDVIAGQKVNFNCLFCKC